MFPLQNIFCQIRTLMESSQPETNLNNTREMMKPGFNNQAGVNNFIRASPSSEQFVSQAASSQMLPQITRY